MINVAYCDNIETLRNCLIDAIEKSTKKSAQIGDLKNKLIKAQQEIIELRKQLEQFTSGKVSIMTIQR